MTEAPDHEEARRTAALRMPNHVLSGPYLDLMQKYEALQKALREIGAIAAEPGEAGAMSALKEAQDIAHAALCSGRVLPFAKLEDVQG